MPKKCIKFVPEYLIPNLNSKRFGERLKWIDKSKNIFEIEWRHKAGPEWTEKEAAVFVEWDKHKGHFKPGDKQYYTDSKQRFRSLLYKLKLVGQLKELKSETKYKKVFCIGQKKKRKKKTDLNAEYDCCNEEEISTEQEYEDMDDKYCRKVSEDGTVNILEDHTYSVTDYAENEQDILSYRTDTCIPTVPSESSENFQKRILMERNAINMNTPMSVFMANTYTDSFSSLEDMRNFPENISASMSTGKLSMDPYLFSACQSLAFDDTYNSSWPNLEFFELFKT